MNGVWILVAVLLTAVVLVPIAIVLGFVIYRAMRPHSKKKAEEQDRLNKKTGVVGGTYTAPPATSPPSKESSEKWYSSYTKYSWTIGLALAGAIIFYVWLYTPGLRFAQVGEWSWDHWLALPAFVGILYVLITNCAGYLEPLAKTLQGGLVGAVLLMYLGIPAGLWVRDVFLPKVFCDDGNPSELTFCKLNTAWSSWFRGKGADGMNLCYDPPGQVEHDYTEKDGTSFYRLRSKEGIVVAKYIFKKMPPDAKKCPKI